MARRSSSEAFTLERCAIVALGVYLSAVGLHMAATGHLIYRNYLLAPVAAPVAIVIGVVIVAAGFFVHR